MILLKPKWDPKTFKPSPSHFLPALALSYIHDFIRHMFPACSLFFGLSGFLVLCESTKCHLLRTLPFSLPWNIWLLPSLPFLLCSNVTFSMNPYWLPIKNCTHMSYHFLYRHLLCFSPFFYYHLTFYLFFQCFLTLFWLLPLIRI